MLAYILLSIVLPASVIFVFSTIVLALFGRSLGVRRLYVRVLLGIFQYARRVARQHSHKHQRSFTIGSEGEETEAEEDADVSISSTPSTTSFPSWTPSPCEEQTIAQDQVDCATKSPRRLPRLVSRHNVISRKDNIILNPVDTVVFPEDDKGEEGRQEEEVKDANDSVTERLIHGRTVSAATFQREFELSDVLDYVRSGVASIIEDEVTQRFEAEELKSWNLLTRTNVKFHHLTWELSAFYWVGCAFRYCVLLPGRLLILLVGLLYMAIGMSLIGPLEEGPWKRWLNYHITTSCFQVLGGAVSLVVTYHDTENRPKGGICVANHTTPIDIMTLACDNAYALTGQRHGGFNGYFQGQLSKASPQIWFERGEAKDRKLVVQRLREHVEDPDRLPILIFPEGTCINNTSVMQFKKGSFEVGGTIYPVAIKYDAKFGDAFWNSSKNSMTTYLLMMMTSWAIVCDVWYLPPMKKEETEDAVDFANRVKRKIAMAGGLVDLVWDGNLKRQAVKSEWRESQQEQFSRRIKVE